MAPTEATSSRPRLAQYSRGSSADTPLEDGPFPPARRDSVFDSPPTSSASFSFHHLAATAPGVGGWPGPGLRLPRSPGFVDRSPESAEFASRCPRTGVKANGSPSRRRRFRGAAGTIVDFFCPFPGACGCPGPSPRSETQRRGARGRYARRRRRSRRRRTGRNAVSGGSALPRPRRPVTPFHRLEYRRWKAAGLRAKYEGFAGKSLTGCDAR